jgi:glycosyltransferase involved in cell wall biosynthesis
MISIILPTYNRFEIVRETIQKIISIKTDILFETIVVNDGAELPFTIEHPLLTVLKNPKRGAASARNYGATHAKYSILFFIDDDMWITEKSLIAIRQFSENGFLNANCVLLNWRYPDELIQKMSQNKIGRYLLKADYHKLEGRLHQKIDDHVSLLKINSVGSGSFVINKLLFDSIGQYNESFIFQGEDIELSEKLLQNKTGIYLYTQLTCFHNQKDRLDINEFTDRDYRGYLSQFKNNSSSSKPAILKQLFFTLLLPFNNIIRYLFNQIPNNTAFDRITFRIIGILSSIAYFKAFYHARK